MRLCGIDPQTTLISKMAFPDARRVMNAGEALPHPANHQAQITGL
jgi:hypothetical protein